MVLLFVFINKDGKIRTAIYSEKRTAEAVLFTLSFHLVREERFKRESFIACKVGAVRE